LLAAQFRIQSIPTVYAIYQGQPVADLTNYRTEGQFTKALDPLLAHNARVVFVTSGLGRLSSQPAALAKRLSAPDLTLADLQRIAEEAPDGYGASKAALIAMARLFAGKLAPRSILVNAISPGWVRTDMGGRNAPRSVQQGAGSILWGVRLPPGGPSGGVFEDGKVLA
jgi:NAD(P)-dependent dehydrogenase (short-subunit alcohol dehydrogenase family)